MPYETDQGTLQLLQHLTPGAAERLQRHLEGLTKHKSEIIFKASEFSGRSDIKELKLEVHESKENVLVATAKMNDGVIWRRGSLRVPGVTLPETMRIAAKGRMIEEIVEGAPFSGFAIISLIQDGSGPKAKLRIRCTAEKTGPIIVDINNAPRAQPSEMAAALLDYADVNIDAVAERALRTLGRDKALAVLLDILKGKQGHYEKLNLRYGAMVQGTPPAHLAVHSLSLTGIITIRKLKAGIRAHVVVNQPGYPYSFVFDKGVAHFTPNAEPRGMEKKLQEGFIGKLLFGRKIVEAKPFEPTIRNILGFEAPNAHIAKQKDKGEWGTPIFAIENSCTVGDLINNLQ